MSWFKEGEATSNRVMVNSLNFYYQLAQFFTISPKVNSPKIMTNSLKICYQITIQENIKSVFKIQNYTYSKLKNDDSLFILCNNKKLTQNTKK